MPACSYNLECKTEKGQDFKGKKLVWKINRDVYGNKKNTKYIWLFVTKMATSQNTLEPNKISEKEHTNMYDM